MKYQLPNYLIAPPHRNFVYRVAGTRNVLRNIRFDPLGPAQWGSTFHGRFDDPRIVDGKDTGSCFRMVYLATRLVGAFGEKIQDFIPDPSNVQKYRSGGYPDNIALLGNWIPKDWSGTLWIGKTLLAPNLRFLDLYDVGTRTALTFTRDLKKHVAALPGRYLNVSALTGKTKRHRTLTQHIALHAYQSTDSLGKPLFDGIRYMSHLNTDWECWAVFYDRMMHSPEPKQRFRNDHPDLLQAARHLGIYVEL